MAEQRVAHAQPTKEFFVKMLTKDISLEDCLLDLLDNSIDGGRRTRREAERAQTPGRYAGLWVRFAFSKDRISVSDNCGGISGMR